jgi:hypothetical protein
MINALALLSGGGAATEAPQRCEVFRIMDLPPAASKPLERPCPARNKDALEFNARRAGPVSAASLIVDDDYRVF